MLNSRLLTIASVTLGLAVFLSVSPELGSSLVESKNQNETVKEGKFVHKVGDFASRMLWMTHDRRFILPNGTLLTIAPSITIPVFRPNQKPFKGGLNSDIKASWYFYMDFSKLGMAGDRHPWPIDFSRPPFYPFGELMRINPVTPAGSSDKENDANKDSNGPGRPTKSHYSKPRPEGHGNKEYDDVPFGGVYFNPQFYYKRHQRIQKRSILSLPPPESIHGGERALLMPSLENLMNNLGFDGRACLLRAVCEIHEYPLQDGYGLFGEIFTLFFSVSRSSYAESHMPEYLKAEKEGSLTRDCSNYYANCTKSIFKWEKKQKPKLTESEATNEV